MARKPKIQIVRTSCPRCGKAVCTTNRSIHGADQAHRKYSGICEDCVTPDERQDMMRAQASAILGRAV